MEIKYFDNGFIGKAVTDINEAIKCLDAGLDICLVNGCDFMWDDEQGNSPNKNEIISRIIQGIKDHGKVYAGFYLEEQIVVPKNHTTLDCPFKKWQTVYFIKDNEICSGTVMSISMTTESYMCSLAADRLRTINVFIKSEDPYLLSCVRDIKTMAASNCVAVKINTGSIFALPLYMVFPTKEALVENLLSNVK